MWHRLLGGGNGDARIDEAIAPSVGLLVLLLCAGPGRYALDRAWRDRMRRARNPSPAST